MMTPTTMSFTEARRGFSTLHERFTKTSYFYVKKHDEKVFAIIDPACLDAMLETLEIMSDPDAYSMLMQSLDDMKHNRLHDHNDVRKELLGE